MRSPQLRVKTFLVVIVLLMFSLPDTALAVPPLPSNFFGTVTIDGANVPDGTVVSAWINGVLFAQTTTTTSGGSSVYTISVPGDDPSTTAVDGGVNGNTVVFVVDGKTATPTGTWQSGTNVSRNLSASLGPPVAVAAPAALTADINGTVLVPITISSDVTGRGIYGWVFTLTFNTSVITPTVSPFSLTGTLSSGWSVEPNTATPGQIRLAAYGTTPLVGSGTLVNLQFNTANSGGAVTALTFTDFVFNEGSPVDQTSNGQLTVGSLALTGNVVYAVGSQAVPGVEMNAVGPASTVSSTNTSGNYGLTINQVGNYTVTPVKAATGQQSAVTGADASLALRHAAGTVTLSSRQQAVADVTATGGISTLDASLIAHHDAGKTPPQLSRVATWTFSPASRSYQPMSSDLASENYTADLYGDVSGDWSSTVRASTRGQTLTSTRLHLPLETAVGPGETAVVSIRADGVENTEIWAYKVEIQYEEKLLRALDMPPAGSTRAGWHLVINAETPGRLVLVGYSTQPLNGDGRLFDLAFETLGQKDDRATVNIMSVRWNEEAVQNPMEPNSGEIVIVGHAPLYLPSLFR